MFLEAPLRGERIHESSDYPYLYLKTIFSC